MPVTIKIQKTIVTETQTGFVMEMIVADAPDEEAAIDHLQFRVTIDTDDQYPRLAKLQKVALTHARDAISQEIRRLELAERHIT